MWSTRVNKLELAIGGVSAKKVCASLVEGANQWFSMAVWGSNRGGLVHCACTTTTLAIGHLSKLMSWAIASLIFASGSTNTTSSAMH